MLASVGIVSMDLTWLEKSHMKSDLGFKPASSFTASFIMGSSESEKLSGERDKRLLNVSWSNGNCLCACPSSAAVVSYYILLYSRSPTMLHFVEV